MCADRSERCRRLPGGWTLWRLGLVAWPDVSSLAVKLFQLMQTVGEGDNKCRYENDCGMVVVRECDAARVLGVTRNAVSEAFAELIKHGLIRGAGFFSACRMVNENGFDSRIIIDEILRRSRPDHG